jgi:hypothetical protein
LVSIRIFKVSCARFIALAEANQFTFLGPTSSSEMTLPERLAPQVSVTRDDQFFTMWLTRLHYQSMAVQFIQENRFESKSNGENLEIMGDEDDYIHEIHLPQDSYLLIRRLPNPVRILTTKSVYWLCRSPRPFPRVRPSEAQGIQQRIVYITKHHHFLRTKRTRAATKDRKRVKGCWYLFADRRSGVP